MTGGGSNAMMTPLKNRGIGGNHAVSAVAIDSNGPAFDADGSISTSIASDGRSCEFVIQCGKDNEMVFVTSPQGKVLRQRSLYFRELFTVGTPEFDERIVKRPEWSVAATRRLIELITTGNLWIENDASVFNDLIKAAETVHVGVRLGSLINYHDVLDEHDTKRFFQMVNIDKYQFKIQVTIKSWQWMDLMRQGVLLLLKSKVLMMKIGHNALSNTSSDPSSSASTNNSNNALVSNSSGGGIIPQPKAPSYDRLVKCDSISSEFCVYANGKLNVLLKILEVLSPPSSSRNQQHQQPHQNQEMFRITYLTKAGGLSQDEMNMLWRITAASYTTATPEERKYLESYDTYAKNKQKSKNKNSSSISPMSASSSSQRPIEIITPTNPIVMKNITTTSGDDASTSNSTTSGSSSTDDISTIHSGGSSSSDKENSSLPVVSTATTPTTPSSPPSSTTESLVNITTPATTPVSSYPASEYHCRTITCNSFLVLKHVFESINRDNSELHACLLVNTPTPDTLGRLINAGRHSDAVVDNTTSSNSSVDQYNELGMDITENCFYAAKSSAEIKTMLGYLADYSTSAIVKEEFKLVEFQPNANGTNSKPRR